MKAIMGDQSNIVDNQDNEEDEVDFSKVTFRAPVEERKGGNALSAYLAFVPIDIKEITHTRFECYFVNDSNYYIQYSYLAADGNSWTLRSQGEVEPNTKEYIEEFGREELNAFGHVAISSAYLGIDVAFDHVCTCCYKAKCRR